MTRTHNFIWLDLETTGLDPRLPGARILELALVLAADDLTGDLAPVDQFSVPIRATAADLAAAWASMDLADATHVYKMHTSSGLLAECETSDVTIEEVDDYLVQWAAEISGATKPRGLVLAGYSVHFDLSWLRVHTPKFAKCLSHRVFDTSTLRAAAKAWLPGYTPRSGDVHRALPDVLASLQTTSEWRQAVGL